MARHRRIHEEGKMRIRAGIVGAALFFAAVSSAQANLKVFACFPEWASLARTLGGDRLEVFEASSPTVNPDYVTATPTLMAAFHDADLAICTGIDFEDEWLPTLQERSGNPKLAVGKPGLFLAANYAQVLNVAEVPQEGGKHHLHEEGNPHVQGDPRNVMRIAAQLTKRLISLDPEGEAAYTANFKDFAGKLKDLTANFGKEGGAAAQSGGHRSASAFAHMMNWLGINVVAALEPEPGVPPGPDFLAKAVKLGKANGVKFVFYAGYEDPKISKYVASQLNVPTVKVPFTVGGTPEAKDLFSFYQDTVDRLLDGLAGNTLD
jgi:zinc/manganese transport system substrate-binding protein